MKMLLFTEEIIDQDCQPNILEFEEGRNFNFCDFLSFGSDKKIVRVKK